MKPLVVLGLIIAMIAGLSSLPAASATTGGTSLKTITVAKAAVNELRAGERLKAPQLGKHAKRYEWLRCHAGGKHCSTIHGATHQFYVVRAADVRHVLRVREALQGNTVAVSAPTPLIGLPLPVNTAIPMITDGGQGGGNTGIPTAVVIGDVLTGSNGTWKYAVSFTYQWDDCNSSGQACTPITGATGSTYTVQSGDIGDTIELVVTAYNYQVP